MKNNKGLSEIIATVLLILIAIIAVGILSAVLIPFARENLNKGTTCFDTIGKITFVSQGSCYNDATPKNTSVRVRFWNINISEMYISLESGENVVSYALKEGRTQIAVINIDPIKMPNQDGGERTYTFNNLNSRIAKVGAIIGGERCDISDTIELNGC
ncbi:MAG: archaellin/type IV pilin N-terminal domain-containing protein [Candidatus Pacearchaeota archaeon]|jgi:flagellin-like protein